MCKLADVSGVVECSDTILACELLLSLLELRFLLTYIIHSGVTAAAHYIFLIIVIEFKLFLNEEKALYSDLDLRHVLSTTAAELSEVIGAAREILQPECQFDSTGSCLLFSEGLSALLVGRESCYFDCELFLLFELDAAEWHRNACKDLVRGPGQYLTHLDRVHIGEVLTLLLGHVGLRLGLVQEVLQLDDLVSFGGFGRFTFRRLVQLLVKLLHDACLVLSILEGVEVAVDELVEHR